MGSKQTERTNRYKAAHRSKVCIELSKEKAAEYRRICAERDLPQSAVLRAAIEYFIAHDGEIKY